MWVFYYQYNGRTFLVCVRGGYPSRLSPIWRSNTSAFMVPGEGEGDDELDEASGMNYLSETEPRIQELLEHNTDLVERLRAAEARAESMTEGILAMAKTLHKFTQEIERMRHANNKT